MGDFCSHKRERTVKTKVESKDRIFDEEQRQPKDQRHSDVIICLWRLSPIVHLKKSTAGATGYGAKGKVRLLVMSTMPSAEPCKSVLRSRLLGTRSPRQSRKSSSPNVCICTRISYTSRPSCFLDLCSFVHCFNDSTVQSVILQIHSVSGLSIQSADVLSGSRSPLQVLLFNLTQPNSTQLNLDQFMSPRRYHHLDMEMSSSISEGKREESISAVHLSECSSDLKILVARAQFENRVCCRGTQQSHREPLCRHVYLLTCCMNQEEILHYARIVH